MRNKQRGFQLLETSIVMAIIALVLGAWIKGQEVIYNAQVKNLTTDFRNIPLYLDGYEDMFRALPGDDRTIGTTIAHLINATSCLPVNVPDHCMPGNNHIDGNWNDTTVASESYLFWQHVRIAGLVSGTITPGAVDYLPTNAVGGTMGIQNGTSDPTKTPINATTGANPIRGGYIVCSQGIMGKLAKQIDIAMDDGIPNSGMMMAGNPTTAGTPMTAVTSFEDSSAYTVCFGF
jgi:type II secretory pathway pseudopilin PulG